MLDDKTIQAARVGRRDAQAVVLQEMQDVWFRFALGLLGREADAHDATQETALRVLKAIGTFDGRSTFKTWSIGIALNVVRETRRKRGPTIAGDEIEPLTKPSTDSPIQSASRAEDVARLRLLLADLPERQREAVMLRYFEDCSLEETAAHMGIAIGTVKACVHQALNALKQMMNP